MKITAKHGLIFAISYFSVNLIIHLATNEHRLSLDPKQDSSLASNILQWLLNALLLLPLLLAFREYRARFPQQRYTFREVFKVTFITGLYGVLFSLPLEYLGLKFISHAVVVDFRQAFIDAAAETNTSEQLEKMEGLWDVIISPGSMAIVEGIVYFFLFLFFSLLSSLSLSSITFRTPPEEYDPS